MEYPGINLGKRGGLFDLYRYYLGGGDESQDTTDPGTQAPNTTGGNQEGFSVYNQDPNRVRQPIGTQRRSDIPQMDFFANLPTTDPRYASTADQIFQQNRADAGEFFYGSPNYIGGAPGNIVQSGPGREFTGDEAMFVGDPRDLGEEKDPSLIAKIRSGIIDNPLFKAAAAIYSPASLLVKGGLQFLQDNLPVNARSIQETQLSQQGIAIDDIGRVAMQNFGKGPDGKYGALDYYDPSGINIMAGYNASLITQDTFDKRRAKAKKKMSEDGFKKFDIALTAAENLWKKTQEVSDKIVDKREYNRRKDKREKIQKDLTAAGFGKAGAVGLDPDMDKQIIDDYTYTPPSRDDTPKPSRDDTPKAPPSKPKQSTFRESYEREDRNTGSSGGGASYDSGSAGTSAGKSTSRGRTDGGWGWKDGGLVQRKPYGNGGIVDLL
jgi:hypothetical protein